MPTEKEFGRWLDAQLKERGIGRAEFAVRTGYESKTIESYIYGQRGPSRQGAKAMADVLGLPPNEVLDRAGHDPIPGGDLAARPSLNESTGRASTALRYAQDISATQFTIIPIIGSVLVVGGRVTPQVDEVQNLRAQDISNITRPAIVFMPDGSMEGRRIEADDQLLIERVEGCEERPADGDVVVVFKSGKKYVREWWSSGDGAILRAAAPGFEPVRVTDEQFEDCEVAVVGIVRKVLRIWAV